MVNRKGPILLHDNARLHVGKITQKKLSSLGIEVLLHPPYSPDLSPTDYHMFRHLDNFLSGKIFDDRRAIEKAFNKSGSQSWLSVSKSVSMLTDIILINYSTYLIIK